MFMDLISSGENLWLKILRWKQALQESFTPSYGFLPPCLHTPTVCEGGEWAESRIHTLLTEWCWHTQLNWQLLPLLLLERGVCVCVWLHSRESKTETFPELYKERICSGGENSTGVGWHWDVIHNSGKCCVVARARQWFFPVWDLFIRLVTIAAGRCFVILCRILMIYYVIFQDIDSALI